MLGVHVLLALASAVVICQDPTATDRILAVPVYVPGATGVITRYANMEYSVVFGEAKHAAVVIQKEMSCPTGFEFVENVAGDTVPELNDYSGLIFTLVFVFGVVFCLTVWKGRVHQGQMVVGRGYGPKTQMNDVTGETGVFLNDDMYIWMKERTPAKDRFRKTEIQAAGVFTTEENPSRTSVSATIEEDKVVLHLSDAKIEVKRRDPDRIWVFGFHWTWAHDMLCGAVTHAYGTSSLVDFLDMIRVRFDFVGVQVNDVQPWGRKLINQAFVSDKAAEEVTRALPKVFSTEWDVNLRVQSDAIDAYNVVREGVTIGLRKIEVIFVHDAHIFAIREQANSIYGILTMVIALYVCRVKTNKSSQALRSEMLEEMLETISACIITYNRETGKIISQIGQDGLTYDLTRCAKRGDNEEIVLSNKGCIGTIAARDDTDEENSTVLIIGVKPSLAQHDEAAAFAKLTGARFLRRDTMLASKEYSETIGVDNVKQVERCGVVNGPTGREFFLCRFTEEESIDFDNCFIDLENEYMERDGLVLEGGGADDDFGIWLMDHSNRRIIWSMVTEGTQKRLANVEKRDLSFLFQFCYPEDVDRLRRSISQESSGRVAFSLEVRMNLSSTEYKWHSVVVSKQNERYMIILAINIDGRKKQIALMRELDETISLGLSYAKVVLWHFDDSHAPLRFKVLEQAKRGADVFNWATVKHNLAAEFRDEMSEKISDCLRNGGSFEMQAPIFYETMKWYLVRGMSIAKPGQIIGIDIDITALKEMEEELQAQKAEAEKAMRAKTRFLANMSHEIRTPLSGMYGLLHSLGKSQVSPDVHSMINLMKGAFVRLVELLNDTLDLAKIEQGKMTVSYNSFSPIDTFVDLIKPLAKKADPAVELSVSRDPQAAIRYNGDECIFGRVVGNLISNAVKFTSEGLIEIWCGQVLPNGLTVRVRDTGIGISDDIKPDLFELFERGGSSATRAYGGIGAGLEVAKKMTDLVGGTISMSSEVGRGTQFTVFFPFEPVPSTDGPVRRDGGILYLAEDGPFLEELRRHSEFTGFSIFRNEGEIAGTLIAVITDREHIDRAKAIDKDVAKVLISRGKDQEEGFRDFVTPIAADSLIEYCFTEFPNRQRDTGEIDITTLCVLVVDDNRTNQLIFKKMCEQLGCRFTIAGGGDEAVTAYNEQVFDVVIMDYYLPGITGPEIAEKLHQVRKVPIIAITASTDHEHAENCMRSGMKMVLVKPVRIKQLRKAISEVLRPSPPV